MIVVFFKQKTAYELRISDWSSDVCSSDLGLGDEFIDVLETLRKLGLDSKELLQVKGVEVAPRDVVAAALPDPATLGDRMVGKTCAGTLVTGIGTDGKLGRASCRERVCSDV